MKKKLLKVMAVCTALALTVTAAGCGQGGGKEAGSAPSESSAAMEKPAVESVAEISYSNVNYDFADQIAAEKEATKLVPATADIPLTVADAKGATGVQLVGSAAGESKEDYYLNAYVAGNELVFTAADGSEIASAESSDAGALEVKEDGTVAVVPSPVMAAEPTDEVITIKMKSGDAYKVHTRHELLPDLEISGEGVAPENAGVYDLVLDKFLLRIGTDGELVYYRNVGCIGELMTENFAKQITADGSCFTYFVELHKDYRNSQGGFSSGMYVVMDENYVEQEQVTLVPNTEENHTHGEGYLDQHEFVVIGKNHYMLLSYTPELVSNLPEGVTGVDGGNTAYVWAGVFQEVQDGKILKEISTTDYPMLYQTAVEKFDYTNSTDQGTQVNINGEMIPSLADGWQDYVHVNSLDYTLNEDGTVNKLLVSMRDQSAVYQFDFASGAMEWILGGKASTLSGYDDYTTQRMDDQNKDEFKALTFGQHFARYTNRNADGTIDGNPEISVFDNQTGSAPFIMAAEVPTKTRTFKAVIDNEAKTATVSDVVVGADLNEKTGKYHNASHCGSVIYANENSVVIGWGLHAVIDNIPAMAPEGIGDIGFDVLKIGTRAIVTEYDVANGKVTFELSGTRNPEIQNSEGFFSYRTYKTAE